MKFKLICVDGTYTGILNGNIFVSESLTTEQVAKLVSNPTEEEVIEIFNPKLNEIRESNKQVKELVDVLLESGLFEEKGGSYYRVGNPISVPKMLLEKYKETFDGTVEGANNFIALDNFWLKCSLNPNVYARENLFEFLQRWGFTITQKGYIVGYRNVDVKQEGNRELHDFIALNYTKIKGQKKAPKNYTVSKVGENLVLYVVGSHNIPNNPIGNLQELYDNLSTLSETIYTDHRTGKMRIVIGEVVSIPKKECDQSQTECSRGLHIGGTSWLKQNYFGSVGLVCLINPMDVVSCPNAGIYGKMRTASYLPIGLAEYNEEGNIIPVATDIFEDDYDAYTIEELNKLLQEIDSTNQVIHQLTFSELPNQVFTTMDEYRVILESKNQSIYPDKDYCANYDEDGDYEEDDYGYDYFDEEE
jgi:hypothetical protein